MSLASVARFRVPALVVERSEQALRKAGAEGYEVFVLWSGREDRSVFEVRTPHVPKQTSYRVNGGLSVRVEGDELHRLNAWLYEAGEMLGVQVHAHPRSAYHSDTDNTYPIVATLGGLSLVAPKFCRRGLFTRGTALYRLCPEGWVEQSISLIEVI
jgi:hypothetical protein